MYCKTLQTLRHFMYSDIYCFKNSVAYSTKAKQFRYRKNRNVVNPGLNLQRKMLKDSPADQIEEDLDVEELESDFMNVGMSYDEHMQEMEAMKERQKHFIVKQKYFKQKMPNFLTWNDKQQIKLLHRTDPEEWTVEKLSQSFPALPEVIAKILKSNWTKKNLERIKHSDEVVRQTWAKFKKGELQDLPPHLTEHLQKFTDRELNIDTYDPSLYEETKKVVYKTKNMKTEFSDIITSYEKLMAKNNEEQKEDLTEKVKLLGDGNEFYASEHRSRRRITLPQLKKDIETAVERGRYISETDKLILSEVKTEDSRNEIVELKQDLSAIQQRHEKPSGVGYLKTQRDYSCLEYPLKVTIPKKVYKRGCTYKLNDCYYDDDGMFLYRVPGMST